MEKNAKINLAGHTGLAGSAILRKLKEQGYNNLILRTRDELDLLKQGKVHKFFKQEKPDYVIISAARVGGIKANMTYPADFLYENLQIQNNIIGAARKYDVKKLLFLGSSCIYPRVCEQPMKEEFFGSGKPEPTNEGYSWAKICGIKLCEKINEQDNKKFISCMPTNIYGPGDNFNVETSHVIPSLIKRIHQAKENGIPEVVIWGSGESRREFLHVDDLADSIIWLMENYGSKEFLNIGTGIDFSIKELALMIREMVGYKGKLVFDMTKPDGMPKKLLDVSKINNLGWKHKIGLKEGLQQTLEWYKENKYIKTTLVLLTYNEIDGVRVLFDKIPFDKVDEVFAVDGGSTDGTREFFQEKGIRIVDQESKGRGEAFRIARKVATGNALIFFSPDGNEDPNDILKFGEYFEKGYDMIIASRMMEGAHNEEDDQLLKIRKWANNAFNWIANTIWNKSDYYITDTINGFRGFRTNAFDKLELDGSGYTIEYQSSIRAMKLGLKVTEFPTNEGERIGGESYAKSIPTGIKFLKMIWHEIKHRF